MPAICHEMLWNDPILDLMHVSRPVTSQASKQEVQVWYDNMCALCLHLVNMIPIISFDIYSAICDVQKFASTSYRHVLGRLVNACMYVHTLDIKEMSIVCHHISARVTIKPGDDMSIRKCSKPTNGKGSTGTLETKEGHSPAPITTRVRIFPVPVTSAVWGYLKSVKVCYMRDIKTSAEHVMILTYICTYVTYTNPTHREWCVHVTLQRGAKADVSTYTHTYCF